MPWSLLKGMDHARERVFKIAIGFHARSLKTTNMQPGIYNSHEHSQPFSTGTDLIGDDYMESFQPGLTFIPVS